MVSRINPLFEKHIQARIFNLKTSTTMRNLNPSGKPCLDVLCVDISLNQPIVVDRGRISEPTTCGKQECLAKNSMTLLHLCIQDTHFQEALLRCGRILSLMLKKEPSHGNYDFAGRYDIVRFLKTVQKAGLYAHLRIGPYICAEWNFGGFPVWLKYVPGISFRTDNEPFKMAMKSRKPCLDVLCVDISLNQLLWIEDNLSRGNLGAVKILQELFPEPGRLQFIYADLGDSAVAYVGESTAEPLRYYHNITSNTLVVLEAMESQSYVHWFPCNTIQKL
ncbi:hypothetical protein POM88_025637 [Heracleum sosnowskyi]|uniref:beta-galactosidase n=1 Tax=Heracleum sosnowskyi TaxID=360622 RepID=A0AAD8I4Y3_9APIA|nr:hypothetical protein POM88_025637 [Heracleum sosnowskyi]